MNKGEFYKNSIKLQQEIFDNEKTLEGKKLISFFNKILSQKDKIRNIKIGNQNIELEARDGMDIFITIKELQTSKKYKTTFIHLSKIMGDKNEIDIDFHNAEFDKQNENSISKNDVSTIGCININTGNQTLPQVKTYRENNNDEGTLHDGVVAINKIFEKIFASKEETNQTKASSLPEQFKKYISGILQN